MDAFDWTLVHEGYAFREPLFSHGERLYSFGTQTVGGTYESCYEITKTSITELVDFRADYDFSNFSLVGGSYGNIWAFGKRRHGGTEGELIGDSIPLIVAIDPYYETDELVVDAANSIGIDINAMYPDSYLGSSVLWGDCNCFDIDGTLYIFGIISVDYPDPEIGPYTKTYLDVWKVDRYHTVSFVSETVLGTSASWIVPTSAYIKVYPKSGGAAIFTYCYTVSSFESKHYTFANGLLTYVTNSAVNPTYLGSYGVSFLCNDYPTDSTKDIYASDNGYSAVLYLEKPTVAEYLYNVLLYKGILWVTIEGEPESPNDENGAFFFGQSGWEWAASSVPRNLAGAHNAVWGIPFYRSPTVPIPGFGIIYTDGPGYYYSWEGEDTRGKISIATDGSLVYVATHSFLNTADFWRVTSSLDTVELVDNSTVSGVYGLVQTMEDDGIALGGAFIDSLLHYSTNNYADVFSIAVPSGVWNVSYASAIIIESGSIDALTVCTVGGEIYSAFYPSGTTDKFLSYAANINFHTLGIAQKDVNMFLGNYTPSEFAIDYTSNRAITLTEKDSGIPVATITDIDFT